MEVPAVNPNFSSISRDALIDDVFDAASSLFIGSAYEGNVQIQESGIEESHELISEQLNQFALELYNRGVGMPQTVAVRQGACKTDGEYGTYVEFDLGFPGAVWMARFQRITDKNGHIERAALCDSNETITDLLPPLNYADPSRTTDLIDEFLVREDEMLPDTFIAAIASSARAAHFTV